LKFKKVVYYLNGTGTVGVGNAKVAAASPSKNFSGKIA